MLTNSQYHWPDLDVTKVKQIPLYVVGRIGPNLASMGMLVLKSTKTLMNTNFEFCLSLLELLAINSTSLLTPKAEAC